MERNLRFKIDWVSLTVATKLTVFALFYLRAISKYNPPGGGVYLDGRFNGGFFALRVWGAYIWRGLFSEFYGKFKKYFDQHCYVACFKTLI